ncbi:MAG: MBL fold metallo-hydrolase [Gemmatimonadetes bacterium]|jgi:ribonuclease Z|nr:MBL fold metallo-hydrolase [Gemmatimonadota bacterium]MBT6148285.1 MBL fold metallo-hydrolase [Gemmatimonadota bacterium]
MALEVGFVGVSSAYPGDGEESTCFLINGDILVDVGFNGGVSLQALGAAPTDIDHIFITHCHHDHTLGLPGMLFLNGKRTEVRPDAPPLRLYGPQDLTAVTEAALGMLQAVRYPQVVPAHEIQHIYPGESVEIGDLRVDVGRAFHPLDARSYRFTDTVTRGSVVITGDTAYHESLSEFARECDVLIHEAAGSPTASSIDQRYLHSRPQDAARVAQEASVGSLALVHYKADVAAGLLARAREGFPSARVARKGQRVKVLGPGQAAWV